MSHDKDTAYVEALERALCELSRGIFCITAEEGAERASFHHTKAYFIQTILDELPLDFQLRFYKEVKSIEYCASCSRNDARRIEEEERHVSKTGDSDR